MKHAGEFLMLSVLACLVLFFLVVFLDSSSVPYAFVGLPEEYVPILQRPSIHSSVSGKTGNGELVKVLGKSRDWYFIETEKGLRGYVFFEHLDLISKEKF